MRGPAFGTVPAIGAVGAVVAAAGAAVTGGPRAAAGLVALLVGVTSLVRPRFGLLVLTAALLSRTFDIGEERYGIPSMALPLAVALAYGVISARPPALRTEGRPALPGLPSLLVYAAVLAGSTFWAIDPDATLQSLLDHMKDLLIAAALLLLLRNAAALRAAIWGVVAASGAVAGIAVFQYLTGRFGTDFGGFAQAPVLNIVTDSDAPRIAGPYGDPNFFGQMMVTALPIAVERYLHERARPLRLIALATAFLVVLTVVFTFSRGSLVGLTAVVGLLLLRYRPRFASVLVAAVFVGVLVWASPPNYRERVAELRDALPGASQQQIDDPALRGRTSEVVVALRMFRDHPITGIGYGNYPVRYQEYSRDVGLDPRTEPRTPHNLPLQVLSETGLLGFVALALVVAAAFRSLARANRRLRWAPAPLNGSAEGLDIALVGFLVTSMFLHLAYPRMFWIIVALALGAGHAATRMHPAPAVRAPTSGPIPART